MFNAETLARVMCRMSQDGTVPDVVQLIPAGRDIKGYDGRTFVNSDPQALVAAFLANDSRELPIDFEHATELLAPNGMQAPAAGWITALEAREDGSIWATVSWNKSGREALAGKEYKYLSPVFLTDGEKNILELLSAGLTNRPNLKMQALNRQETPKEKPIMKSLLKALGLEETAAEADALVALNALQTKSSPSLDKFVPRAEFDVVMNRAKTAEAAIETAKQSAMNAQVDVVINEALRSGKISPATKDFYVDYCKQEGGLAKFEQFLAVVAPVVTPGATSTNAQAKPSKGALSQAEIEMCSVMAISHEAYIATRDGVKS